MLEPGIETTAWSRIFRPYGVEVGDNVVVDPNPVDQSAQGFGPDAPVVRTKFEAHPITNKLKGSGRGSFSAGPLGPCPE